MSIAVSFSVPRTRGKETVRPSWVSSMLSCATSAFALIAMRRTPAEPRVGVLSVSGVGTTDARHGGYPLGGASGNHRDPAVRSAGAMARAPPARTRVNRWGVAQVYRQRDLDRTNMTPRSSLLSLIAIAAGCTVGASLLGTSDAAQTGGLSTLQEDGTPSGRATQMGAVQDAGPAEAER